MPNDEQPGAPTPALTPASETPWWHKTAEQILEGTSLPHAAMDVGLLAMALVARELDTKRPSAETKKLAKEIALKMAAQAQPRRPPAANELPKEEASETPPPTPTQPNDLREALAAYELEPTKH